MRRILFLLAVTLYLIAPAHGQTPNQAQVCNAALAKDITTTFHSQQEDLDFLKIIDKETYNAAKEKGSFGASVPIADDLLKISANWDNFQENRSKYLEVVKYVSHSEAQDFRHFEVTSPIAYQAWTTCVLAYARQGTGFYAWKQQEVKDNIVVQGIYHQPGATKPVTLKAFVKRGDEPEKAFPLDVSKITNEQIVTLTLPRTSAPGGMPTKSVILRFNAGMFSDYVYSVWTDPPKPPKYKTTTTAGSVPCIRWLNEFALQGIKPTNDTQLIGTLCTAPGLPTSVRYDKCQGEGCDHIWPMFEANIVEPDGRTVNVRFRTNHGNPPPLLSMTIFYTVTTQECEGDGCPVRLPSEVLKKDCPATGCQFAIPATPTLPANVP